MTTKIEIEIEATQLVLSAVKSRLAEEARYLAKRLNAFANEVTAGHAYSDPLRGSSAYDISSLVVEAAQLRDRLRMLKSLL